MDRFAMQFTLGYVSPAERESPFSPRRNTIIQASGRIETRRHARGRDRAQARSGRRPHQRRIETLRGGHRFRDAHGESGVQLGASPRASISLMKIAQALALFDGSDFVTPEQVQSTHRGRSSRIAWCWSHQARFSAVTARGVVEDAVKKLQVPARNKATGDWVTGGKKFALAAVKLTFLSAVTCHRICEADLQTDRTGCYRATGGLWYWVYAAAVHAGGPGAVAGRLHRRPAQFMRGCREHCVTSSILRAACCAALLLTLAFVRAVFSSVQNFPRPVRCCASAPPKPAAALSRWRVKKPHGESTIRPDAAGRTSPTRARHFEEWLAFQTAESRRVRPFRVAQRRRKNPFRIADVEDEAEVPPLPRERRDGSAHGNLAAAPWHFAFHRRDAWRAARPAGIVPFIQSGFPPLRRPF